MLNEIRKKRKKFIQIVRECSENLYVPNYIEAEELEAILFDVDENGFKFFAVPSDVISKLDFSNISLNNVSLVNENSELITINNAVINCSNIKDEIISNYKFSSCSFINGLEKIKLDRVRFIDCPNLIIEPQRFKYKDFRGCSFENVEFIGLFDGVMLEATTFLNCKNVIINPQTVYDRNLQSSTFHNVDFIGTFDNCKIRGCCIIDCKGATINPQIIFDKDLSNCKFHGVKIEGLIDGCNTKGLQFPNPSENDKILRFFVKN